MGSHQIAGFIDRQAVDVMGLYRAGTFWIAVDAATTLERRRQKISRIPGYSPAIAFRSHGSIGDNVLWCATSYKYYRDAMSDFLISIGVSNGLSDIVGFDADHAFSRAAALERARIYKVAPGYLRMHLVKPSANRSFGSGIEQRQKQRIFTHSNYCRGNLGDVLKACSFDARGLCPDPWRMLAAGVNDLFARKLITSRDMDPMYKAGIKEFLSDQQAGGESYAAITQQI